MTGYTWEFMNDASWDNLKHNISLRNIMVVCNAFVAMALRTVGSLPHWFLCRKIRKQYTVLASSRAPIGVCGTCVRGPETAKNFGLNKKCQNQPAGYTWQLCCILLKYTKSIRGRVLVFFSICMSDTALCRIKLLTSRLNLCRSSALDFFIRQFSFAAYAMISFFTSLFVCSTASSFTWDESLSAICFRRPGSFFRSIVIAVNSSRESFC